ncbi:MAG: carnitine dehydratase [Acidobacteria bacterium RIFCSPLOWO2_02_FULL_67_36]|nr:MAG: carnitine dehydratase [Acidobacteria bacterium RIFCSPLOWO2_02_FULL_67_36]OFW24973.1 MAG: carnitine dehydratase [Acidobacteria bacterium RIFCSPLOWO2_12_FULL_66_21]
MSLPLQDIQIVSLATNVPGPVAAAALRDMGAGVLKAEPPGGDPLAFLSAAWHDELCRGMARERFDLKSSGDRARFDGHLAAADVLLTSSRPEALTRLGLGWPDLHLRHPRLSMVSIVGYPSPRQNVAGHDLTYQAEAGLVTPPALPRSLVSDLAGAQQAVIAVLGLLFARERGGEGGFAEIALADSARAFANPATRGLTSPDGMLGGALPVYNVYPAREGWVAIAALEVRFRNAIERELNVDAADGEALARVFAQRTAREWQAWAEARDLPLVEVVVPRV